MNLNVRRDLPGRFSELNFFKENFSRILNIYNGNIMPPYEVLIHPCSFCNLSCKWCIGSYVTRDKNKSKILENKLNKVENMEKVIEGIIKYKKVGLNYLTNQKEEFKIENVSFSGITGEPMIAKDSLIYAIQKLKSNNKRVGMFTNGILITKDTIDTIIKMDYVLISIDAGDKITYSKLKCDNKHIDTFNEVINNIKMLNDEKKRKNSTIDINVGYIVNQYNYSEIYKLAETLKKIGVHYLRLKTDISSQMLLSDEQNIEVNNQVEKVKKEIQDDYFKIIEIHKIGDEKQKIRDFDKCFIHYLYGAISADGNVYPCNYHPKRNGYFYESAITKDFADIWNNITNYDIDKQIPIICPERCDPFKTRANRLLEEGYYIYKNNGLEALKKYIYK